MERMYPLVSEKLPHFFHGGDYNPEQWPTEVREDDMRLMKLAHWNLATVGVFSWVSLQPAPDQWDFDWLDAVLDNLAEGGMFACLATPTAAPPAWLSHQHPASLRTDAQGRRHRHGNRVNYCPNSAAYREACADVAGRLAERYKEHPALVLWHVSNEYCGVCYCETCAHAFRRWLEAKYGSLDELNERWYTRFWSHTFTDWSQIEPPLQHGESMPALRVDYRRFNSDSLLGCYLNEARVLREVTPGVPVTTNMMGAHPDVDYHTWAPHVDVVAWDSYPGARSTPEQIAFYHDLMRGLKRDRPFLLMEQTPSSQNWQAVNALKRPGQMRLWSYQAVAHGSDAVMYFQWRRGRGGHEKLHGAVVAHAGHENTRVFQEVTELGQELENLGDAVLGSATPAKVAIIFDWENWWTLDATSGPIREKRYVQTLVKHYAALRERNIMVDVVSARTALEGYSAIVAPMLYMVRQEWAEKVTEFVRGGGRFVATAMTGWVDETDLAYLGGYPGALREVLGVWVEEIDALFEDQSNEIRMKQPFGPCRGEYKCGRLCELLHAEEASVLGTYGADFYAGWPVVTENRLGQGFAYYIGTDPEPEFLGHFYRTVCADCGVFPPLEGGEGIEITCRSQKDRNFIFVLNHRDDVSFIDLGEKHYRDLLTGRTHTANVPVRGFDVRILEEVEPAPAEEAPEESPAE